MRKVITYGTYQLIHEGHINLLKRAKELGDFLILGLSTNEFNDIKNKITYQDYEERKKVLSSIKYIDLIIPEKTWNQKIDDILNLEIDVFTMGSDWEGQFDYLQEFCEVVYLPRTENISSTKIVNKIQNA